MKTMIRHGAMVLALLLSTCFSQAYAKLSPETIEAAKELEENLRIFELMDREAEIQMQVLADNKRIQYPSPKPVQRLSQPVQRPSNTENSLSDVLIKEAKKLRLAVKNQKSSPYHMSLISLLDQVAVSNHESRQKQDVIHLLDKITLAPTDEDPGSSMYRAARADVLKKFAELYEDYWQASNPGFLSMPFLVEEPIPVADVLMMTLIAMTSPNTEGEFDKKSLVVVESSETAQGCAQWALFYQHRFQSLHSRPDMQFMALDSTGRAISFSYTTGVGSTRTGLNFITAHRANQLKKCELVGSHNKERTLDFKQKFWQ